MKAIGWLVFYLSINCVALAQLDFELDPSTVSVGDTVTATILGTISTSILDWGDGAQDTIDTINTGEGEFTHSYQSPGNYIVRLTDTAGNLLAREANVTVSLGGDLDANTTEALVNETVTFTASNLSRGASYRLDFGDGASESFTSPDNAEVNLFHAYTQVGTVLVQLQSVLADGSTRALDRLQLSIEAADITLEVEPETALVNQTVTARIAGLAAGSTARLDWGDGTINSIDQDSSVSHEYLTPGVYIVELSSRGSTERTTVSISLSGSLDADPVDPFVNQELRFSASELIAGLEYQLDFGDGESSSFSAPASGTINLSHRYSQSTTVVATLSANLGGNLERLDSLTLNVRALDIEVSLDPEELLVGEELTATISGLPAGFNGSIDWADGTSSAMTADGNYRHRFSEPGSFLITLNDAAGNALARATARVSLEIEMILEPEDVRVGETVTATLSGLADGFSGTLNWADGSTDSVSTNGDYSHSFFTPGSFLVTLTDAAGTFLARATVNVSLTGDLDAAPLDPFMNQAVSFTASDLTPNLDYRVDFGNGETWAFTATSTTESTTYSYSQANPAIVAQLFAELPTGSQLLDSLGLNVQMPEFDLEVDPTDIILGESVTATIAGLSAGQSLSLNWGDGQTEAISSNGSYLHRYNEVGIETLELSFEGLVVDRATVTISLSGVLEATPERFVLGESVSFSASELAAGYEHRLDFGDGSSETFTAPETGAITIEHVYSTALTNLVVIAQLSIILPLEESLLDTVSLTVEQVDADESLSHDFSELPANEIVVDISANDLIAGADYLIDFGDGTQEALNFVTTSETVEHGYATEAVYVVQLFLQSSSGRTVQATDTVNAQWPRSDESLSVLTDSPKVDESTEFLAENLTTIYSYDVSFEGLQNDQTPPFTGVSEQSIDTVYLESGSYNSQLYVTYPDGLRELRDTAFVIVKSNFTLTDVDWSFSGESTLSDDDFSGLSETVQLNEAGLSVTIDYDYEGSGTLEATLEREGEVIETITQALYGFSQGDYYTSLPLATDQEGVYSLNLSILNPEGSYALTPLTYVVSDIQRLVFGGFVVRVTDIENADPNSFSGVGILEDFVFAGRLQSVPIEVSFNDLTLQKGYQDHDDWWEVLAGEALQDTTVSLSLAASLSGMAVHLQGMTLSPTGALISGFVSLPFSQGSGLGNFQFANTSGSESTPQSSFSESPTSQSASGEWRYVPVRRFLNGASEQDQGDAHDAYANMEVSYLLDENNEVSSTPLLLYDGVPVTSGLLAHELTHTLQQATQQQTDGVGFANPEGEVSVNRVVFNNQPLPVSGNFSYTGVTQLDEEIRIVHDKVIDITTGQHEVIIDFSKTQNPDQAALNNAYLAWGDVETPQEPSFGFTWNDSSGPDFGFETTNPPSTPTTPIQAASFTGFVATPHTSPNWMGLVLKKAPISYTTTSVQSKETNADIAWTSAGFNSFFSATNQTGSEQISGWEVDLKSIAVAIKNSNLLEGQAIGTINLPLFEEEMWVKISQTNGGSSIRSISPVWHNYGNTVLFAYNAEFAGSKLIFSNAFWGFNDDFSTPEPPPGTFSEGPNGISVADSFVLAGINGYSGASWGEITFLQANYESQIRIPQLSVYANGNVDLNGSSERTLNDAPNITFMDYPFLNGSGQIKLSKSGNNYNLALTGGLELAENIGTTEALMSYGFQNGAAQTWTFDAEPIQPEVNGVTFAFDDIEGELDVSGNDLSFAASGEIPLDHLGFKVGVSGAFGRQNAVRYWYVSSEFSSGGDAPIIDTGGGLGGQLAFWSFGGGASHNLTTSLDVTGNETCSFLSWKDSPENAKSCVNSSNPWAFYAETVISPTESYGGENTVHIHGLLEVSAQGGFNLLGRGWFMRSFAEGYDAGSAPQAAVHVGIDASRFVLTACVGQNSSPIVAPEGSQSLDCTGLAQLTFPQDTPVIEYRGWGQLLADWQNNHYYLAVGSYDNRISASFFNLAFREGYLILGSGLPNSWLPPNANEGSDLAFYTGRSKGVNWDFEHKWGSLCERRVWANVDIGNELNLLLELSPFAMGADIAYWAEAGAGYDGCIISVGIMIAGEVHGSVYVSKDNGELDGGFSGSIRTKKVLGGGWNTLINVSKNFQLTLWGG